MAPRKPRHGEIVELELLGGMVVRNPSSGLKHKTGDRIRWTTFYQRRALEGALRARFADTSAQTTPESPEPKPTTEG